MKTITLKQRRAAIAAPCNAGMLAQFFSGMSQNELREVCRVLMPIIARKFRRAAK